MQRGPGAKNGFYAYLRSERSYLEHLFSVFLSYGGAPKRRGTRDNFPLPLSTGLNETFRTRVWFYA